MRKVAIKSALKAMLINKLGDICLLLSFGLIFVEFGTFDYFVIFELVTEKFKVETITDLSFFVDVFDTFLFFSVFGLYPYSFLGNMIAIFTTPGIYLLVNLYSEVYSINF